MSVSWPNRIHLSPFHTLTMPATRTSKLTSAPRKAKARLAPSSSQTAAQPSTASTHRQPTPSHERNVLDTDAKLAAKKLQTYRPFVSQTPFPTFGRPTVAQCHEAHDKLSALHQDAVDAELTSGELPERFPHVLDSLIVAIFSQATSWTNAKRAIANVQKVYGSTFAYDAIWEGGASKLQETIKCGGLHVRKTMMIMSVLGEVKTRYGDWTLDHLHQADDQTAMEELLGYKYVGVKTASVVMSWSLKRQPFTVDTHVYRIAGLWGWRPAEASKEDTQAHLEHMIPAELRANLHFLLIQHGRQCPACRGGAKAGQKCTM